tara:strand:+ start:342 stop:842 length:501 start_codon:yes stop_codon:yes gene_type:complete
MPILTTPSSPTELTALATSGGADTSWFIHEQTLSFAFDVFQEGQVGNTYQASSLHVAGNVAVSQYIVSSFQFSAAETKWHTVSGEGFSSATGKINAGHGYIYTAQPGYIRRRSVVLDQGSGCNGSFSFTMDPAQLDITNVVQYAKIYASIPANGGCADFQSWLINY